MIIVFGGSFNPITKAHLNIYEYLKKRFSFSKFIFLPTSTIYSKVGLESNENRYNMLKLALKDEKVLIDDSEFKEKKYEGTYAYLKSLNEKDIYFVMGADNLKEIKTWIKWESLIKEFKFIVFNRNKTDLKGFIENDETLNKYIDNFVIIEEFDNSLSSSEFRRTRDKSLVPDEVFNYIEEKNLYRGN